MGVLMGLTFGALLALAALAAMVSALFLWAGAKMARVPGATFGKAVLAALAGSFVSWLVSLLFSVAAGPGTLLGWAIGTLMVIFVIKGVYGVALGKALLVWVFHLVAQVITVLVVLSVLAGGTLALLAG
jgi:hypothetical protein